MLYGPAVWDPVLIVAQIATVQCIYYLGLGVLMGMLVGERVTYVRVQDRAHAALHRLGSAETPLPPPPFPTAAPQGRTRLA